jgi:predicted alpha/beta superfamily hydrolase
MKKRERNLARLLGFTLAGVLVAGNLQAADEPAPAAAPRPSTAQPNVHVLPAMTIPGLGRERTIRLYLPPGYETSSARYPVLYMHDGQNLFDAATSFLGEWEVDETLNALARERGLELIVVGIDNGGEHRVQELTAWDNPKWDNAKATAEGAAYSAFIVDVVKPYIDTHYRTKADRRHTAIMGSSLGGLISHYAIHRYPQVFGKAGLFSPSYWYAPEAYAFTTVHPLPHDAKLYFYCGGREDEEMLANMRRMTELERKSGLPQDRIAVDVDVDAEHNEAAWRKEFPRAVAWLFDATR